MIAVVLFIYSIYEMLKFLFFATLGDIVTTIKGNYDSPERDQAVKRDLWMAAKSIIAFLLLPAACWFRRTVVSVHII